MRKTGKALLFCILIVAVLSGCDGVEDGLKFAVCSSYSVPGMMCYDLKGGTFKYEVLETDEYGRIFYEFTSENIITECEESVYIICQKMTDEKVYYYEDDCYTFTDNDENIDLLKRKNDWGKALDNEKMTFRPIDISMDLNIVFDKVLDRDLVKQKINQVYGDGVIEKSLLDVSPRGSELYYIKVIENDKQIKTLVIVDTNYCVHISEIENLIPDGESVKEFREKSGW